MSPETLHNAIFCTSDLVKQETNENKVRNPQVSLNQTRAENVTAQNYVNLDADTEPEVALEGTDEFTECDQQATAERKMMTVR
jgi:hypothetical protein